VSRLDRAKLLASNDLIGSHGLEDMREAWDAWRAALANHAPATIVRSRALLLSAIRCGCGEKGVQPPSLPAVGAEKDMRMAMLTTRKRRRQLASYSPHAACPGAG
jgi:hypothetical protein